MDIDTPHQLTSFRDFELRLARERREPRNESSYNERESTATTATLRGDSMIREVSVDLDMPTFDTQPENSPNGNRFIVAIDFGTTFSSISFLALPRDSQGDERLNPYVYLAKIQSIINFPEEPRYGLLESRKEVPTEIWYPKQEYMDHTLVGGTLGSEIPPPDDGDVHMYTGDENSGQENEAEDDEADADDEENKDTYWGYQIQKHLRGEDTNRNQNRRMARFKLLLDESQFTERVRLDLAPNLKLLKRRKIIKDQEDVIADYLKYLFSHTKEQLMEHHEYTNDCPVEFVLCVPPIWTPKACRIMQTNMERAIRGSGLGSAENDCVDNLFIVSEPEAAASYVLAGTTTISRGDAFVLLDAGGGTVDAITYTVDNSFPLRLKSEAVEAGGALCGSSYLNEAFQEHLLTRLAGEDYLERNNDDVTIRGIIDARVVEFENEVKRKVDVTILPPKFQTESVYIRGLKANTEKRFSKNRVKLGHSDFEEIFLPILEQVGALMEKQLELAKLGKINVTKVILIGGFANSSSLRSYLEKRLSWLHNYEKDDIDLVFPQSPEPAVASGAILRALYKKDGPRRICRSSYGFRCHEEYNPDVFPAHKGIRPFSEPLDGRKYLKCTIDWLILKGDKIPSYKEYCLPVFYIFDAEEGTRFECEEVLFVSDDRMESHYRDKHPKNKGAAKRVGTIETDMTFLKERNLIQPVEVEDGVRAKRHYNVKFELVMIVNDRNLRWEARYPAGGEVQGRGQISIASAFVPGTK